MKALGKITGDCLLRAAALVVAGGLLLLGCSKDKDRAGVSDPDVPTDAVTVGFRAGTLAIAGASDADDGWNVRSAKEGASASRSADAATRADDPPAPDPGPDVENPDDLPVGTTFRVVVYEAGADPQSESPVDQNTYKIADAGGTIVATAVDGKGNATEGAARELVLRRGAYDFYYFSPAVPANTAMPNPGRYTGLANGADYMALAHREVIDPSQGPKHYIPEVCFYRMGSYIDVRISPRDGEVMGTLEVTGDGLQLWGLPASGSYEIGDYPYRLVTEGSGGMVEFAPASFGAEEDKTATVSTLGTGGGRAVLPGYARDLQVKVTLTSDGKELKLDASLAGYNFAPGYRYVVELGVGRIADNPELSIEILPWNEYDWGDGDIGGLGYIRSATVTPSGDIPGEGKTYSLTLNGVLPSAGVEVCARVDRQTEPLVSGKVTASGTAVELAVPANMSYDERTVSFEYKWGDEWKKIEPDKERKQRGWTVDARSHNAPATIPGNGGTYTVELSGWLGGNYALQAVSDDDTVLVGPTSTSTDDKQTTQSTELKIPANTGAQRSVTFQYKFKGEWLDISPAVNQAAGSVTGKTISPDPSGGFSADATTFTVTLSGYLGSGIPVQARLTDLTTVVATATATTSGTGVTLTVPTNSYPNAERMIVFGYVEGGEFKEIKRGTQAAGERTIDTGGSGTVLETPDPGKSVTWQEAIDYCSSKGDGWRLPTQNELMYYWCVEPSIPADSKFSAGNYWSATESSSSSSEAWFVDFSLGITNYYGKTNGGYVRCVRDN